METVLKSLELAFDENKFFIPYTSSFIGRYGHPSCTNTECRNHVESVNFIVGLQIDHIYITQSANQGGYSKFRHNRNTPK